MSTVIHNSEVCTCEQCRWAESTKDAKGLLWADAATIRAALMDVTDSGIWTLHESQFANNETAEDEANRARSNFADAVLRRLVELQSPPHNAPRGPKQ